MRTDPGSISTVAFTRPEWRYIAAWMTDFINIVGRQERSKLDDILPDEFVRAVLSKLNSSFYLNSDDRHLRDYSIARSREERMSAVEAYERFGGAALEDVIEKGSFPIDWLKQD